MSLPHPARFCSKPLETSMQFHCEHLKIRTQAPIEIVDVTDRVKGVFEQHSVQNGQVTVSSAHSTAFIALNEKEPMLQRDMIDFLARFIPEETQLKHNIAPIDGRKNAHSHLIGLFMNASETIPIAHGKLLLGAWQSVFFVELDGPREEREIRVQVVGER